MNEIIDVTPENVTVEPMWQSHYPRTRPINTLRGLNHALSGLEKAGRNIERNAGLIVLGLLAGAIYAGRNSEDENGD